MARRIVIEDPLLTPGDVSRLLNVDPKTVARWARAGKLTCVWTPGGHRRYRASEVEKYLNGGEQR